MDSNLGQKQHVLDLGEKVLEQIELKNSFKEKFNIFKTLGIERREVDLHSKFLYELLNPNGSHNCGSIYLELFIKELMKNKKIDLSKAKVTREHLIKSNKRIDFVISDVLVGEERHNLLIEMKIEAGDQKDQLKDYDAHGKNEKNQHKLYYLTLDGSEATEKSTGCEGLVYKRISFEEEILNFIEKSIEKSSTIPSLRETLIQYKKTILDICSEPEEEDKKIMKDFLLKNDNLKIVEELSKAIPEAKFEIELKFWNELKGEIGAELEKYSFYFDNDEGLSNVDEIKNTRSKKWLASEIYYVYNENFNENVLSIGIANAKADDDFYFFFQMFDKSVKIVELKNIKGELLEEFSGLLDKDVSNQYLYKYCDTDFQYENQNFYKLQNKSKREEIIIKMKDGLFEIAKYIHENKDKIDEILKRI